MIDLDPMTRAVATLTESIKLVNETWEQLSKPMRLLVQRGIIQAFEYNYEMAIVMMTRYLKETASDPEKHDLSAFQELIRVADEHRLTLSPISKWKAFRHARNMTSHAYKEENALAVVAIIPDFEREVVYLLSQLRGKSAQ